MPARYQYLRVNLELEQARLLHWGENAGLTEDRLEETSRTLQLNREVILDVLLEINKIFQQTLRITGKFDATLKSKDEKKKQTSRSDALLQKTLAILDKRKELSLRLEWTMVKQADFTIMVDRLISCNSRLESLLDSATLGNIHKLHLQTNMKLLQIYEKIESLELLSQALVHASKPGRIDSMFSDDFTESAQMFARLADFKAHQLIMDGHEQGIHENLVPQSEVRIWDESTARPRAEIRGRNVWIEWKDYEIDPSPTSTWNRTIQNRVSKLANLLGSPKNPPEFRTPFCVGYLDDRTQRGRSRYGLLYSFPDNVPLERAPVSLYQLFTCTSAPSLNKRVDLAHKVARSLMFLHAVNWLHKGISSHAILFRSDKASDISEPILSGFDFARPDLPSEITERPAEDLEIDMYRHPDILATNSASTTSVTLSKAVDPSLQRSRKLHDVYSLGLVLLEIGHWKPLKEIAAIDIEQKGARTKILGLRQMLLSNGDPSIGSLSNLASIAGDTYQSVFEKCVSGGALGEFQKGEDGSDPVEMQRIFAEDVVNKLSEIKV